KAAETHRRHDLVRQRHGAGGRRAQYPDLQPGSPTQQNDPRNDPDRPGFVSLGQSPQPVPSPSLGAICRDHGPRPQTQPAQILTKELDLRIRVLPAIGEIAAAAWDACANPASTNGANPFSRLETCLRSESFS